MINDAYLLAPWADALYFADTRWWQWHHDGIDRLAIGLSAEEVKKRFAEFQGERISITNVGTRVGDPSVMVLKNMNDSRGTSGRLSTDPAGIYTGQNSGYQAIGVAALKGATRIILLGYDMKVGNGDRHHFFGDHKIKSDAVVYRQFQEEFKRMAPNARAMGIEIVNATSDTELDCFPRVKLEEVL